MNPARLLNRWDAITLQWAAVLVGAWVCGVVFSDRLLLAALVFWTGGLALFWAGEYAPSQGLYRAGVWVMRVGLIGLVLWAIVLVVHIAHGYQPFSEQRWRTA